MRPRAKKNMGIRMSKCKHLLVEQPDMLKGKWSHDLFGNDNPLHIEIGCGKGTFIVETARANPEINYIGIELVDTVLLLALEKAVAIELPNLRFVLGNADKLLDMFEKKEVDRIYINFSDPWPKRNKEKFRLTHSNYLSRYEVVLNDGARVFQKTDNRTFFDYSVKSFKDNGWVIENLTYDLHNSGFEGNIMTEYEQKFSSLGVPINRLEAYKMNE